jgi:hypothetical protein
LLIVVAALGIAGAPNGVMAQPAQKPQPWAFPETRGSVLLRLLSSKSVLEDLKLSDEQKEKLAELLRKQQDGLQELRKLNRDERARKAEELNKAHDQAATELLKPEQLQRLKQILLQQRGPRALADPEVAQALRLTNEQSQQVTAILKETSQIQATGNLADILNKLQELQTEKLMGVLTDEQKARWKELQGEPFKGTLRPGLRGRGPAIP